MIQTQLNLVRAQIPEQVTLIAVSKTKPVSDLQAAYDAGQRHFGENKVQEMVSKWEVLPKDINWHLIGHLQSNKVKYIAPFVSLIHSVDSFKLLQEINKQAIKNERVIDCLLQIYIAQEDTKFGLSEEEAIELLESSELKELQNIRLVGLMGMATFTDNKNQVKSEFLVLKSLFDELSTFKKLETLSMGMSDDFALAIECGSTSVRIGSAIFGVRNY